MSEPRIGLALGSGGARGLAHIAVLEVIDEFGIHPSVIAGCSIGAFIGSGYAAGMSGKEIRAYATETFADRGSVLAKLWEQRPKKLTDLFAGGIGIRQLDAEWVTQVFLPETLPNHIEDLRIPFRAVATDFYGWQPTVIDSGDLRSAVSASIAIPFLFKPVVRSDRVLVDGAATNPLPFDIIRGDADITIAVDVVDGPKGDPTVVPKAFDSIFGATQLLMQSVITEKLAHSAPDILVRPNINIFAVLDFFKITPILRASETAKDELRRDLERALTNWERTGKIAAD
ncbi:MAG: patatin-like phospholipase family protein [Pseudomonadota bacterium]